MMTQFAKSTGYSYLDSFTKDNNLFLNIFLSSAYFKSSVFDGKPYITLAVVLLVIKLKAHQNPVSKSAVYI